MTKKKKILAAVISLCILVAGAVTALHILTKEEPILPPVRLAERNDEILDDIDYIDCRLIARIKDSELKAIVLLEVKNWLGEGEESGTFYEAEVIKCYKGDINSKIKLVRSGNSKETLDRTYPLFTYGNKLLVALAETNETYFTADGKEISEDLYYILNAHYGAIRVEEDNSGNLYFMHYYCFWGGDVTCPIGDTSPLEFSVAERKIRDEVKANAKENDPFLPGCQHIYSLSDFEKYLETVES